MIIYAPLLSPNEPEAEVTELPVTLGQQIGKGDVVCVLSTTKTTFDIEAESVGYVQSLFVTVRQTVSAGDALMELGESPVPVTPQAAKAPEAEPRLEGLRVTDRAASLMRELGVDASILPRNRLITEALVRSISKQVCEGETEELVTPAFDASAILIYGAGGHAKTLIDLISHLPALRIVGLVDDFREGGADVLGVPLLGRQEVLPGLSSSGVRLAANGMGGLQEPRQRVAVFARLAKLGFAFPALVHPRAVVEQTASISAGVQVFAGAIICSAATVAFGAIINTGVVVSHDCRIDSYAHITPGVLLAGLVRVGTGAIVGMGVTTAVGVSIGAWSRIGNGARIHGDVPAHGVVPAGSTWPSR